MRRRVIAHIDADAFYASVHLLEDPSLAGKPVIVAGAGARSIVTTASYEARRYGIGSAQPAARARMLCPNGIFIEPDFELYRSYSRRAMAIVRDVSQHVEPLSLDEAYLDVTGLERPVRQLREMVRRIHQQTGLYYSVGIGPNKLCAKVLSDHRKPRAFNVASREQCAELFADASPQLIPGIGPRTTETLRRLGIGSIGELRSADAGVLASSFGEGRAAELQARARFEHDGEVVESHEPKSLSEETTFADDIADHGELDARLRMLAEELVVRLQRLDLRGRTIGIKVRLADFTTVTRSRTIQEPTNDSSTVASVAAELLAAYAPTDPVRLLGVRVAGFNGTAPGAGARPAWQQLRLPFALPAPPV